MNKPIVAIVGRPNVGKSTLFNKIIGQRRSIVDDTPGVTRDRIFGDADWNGSYFSIIDTGGLETETNDEIKSHVVEQVMIALEMSDAIIMVCDINAGVTAADIEVAQLLTKSGKQITLAVNKVDRIGDTPLELYDFYSLGLGQPFGVSSLHGYGTGDLLDDVVSKIPHYTEEEENEQIKVAVIGRPNVGKSTLVNTILNEDRMIVSEIAGTTRDAVDAAVENEYGSYLFIDTAGMRKKGRISGNIERYSVMRALAAVDRADVAVIMLDAIAGYAEQDSKVAGYAHEKGKGCIIAINKWDLVEKDGKTMDVMRKKYMNDFSFMPYAPIIFISAESGQRVNRLFELINFVNEQNSMRISTGMLNEVLARATARVQPPSDKGRRLKIYYITQPSTRPPTFVVFVNKAELFHFSYQRYIENQIRETFGLEGTPIRMITREREQK